jgi:hypothetical protein
MAHSSEVRIDFYLWLSLCVIYDVYMCTLPDNVWRSDPILFDMSTVSGGQCGTRNLRAAAVPLRQIKWRVCDDGYCNLYLPFLCEILTRFMAKSVEMLQSEWRIPIAFHYDYLLHTCTWTETGNTYFVVFHSFIHISRGGSEGKGNIYGLVSAEMTYRTQN